MSKKYEFHDCSNSTFQDYNPLPAEDPVPEWQIQPVDEEPPDVIDLEAEITPNIAYARLQTKSSLVEVQPTSNNTAEDMVVVISDDEPELETIEQPQPHLHEIQHPPPAPAYHEMSLQDRLRNLAGVPIPGTPGGPPLQGGPPPLHQENYHQPPPLMHQPPPMNTTRPPPPFSDRPPGGGPMRGGRGNRGGMNGNRGQPFHNNRGRGRGFQRGFQRGGRW